MWNIIWTYFICHDSVGLFSSCFQRAHTYTHSLGTKIFPDTLTVSQFSVLELRLCACVWVSVNRSDMCFSFALSLSLAHTHSPCIKLLCGVWIVIRAGDMQILYFIIVHLLFIMSVFFRVLFYCSSVSEAVFDNIFTVRTKLLHMLTIIKLFIKMCFIWKNYAYIVMFMRWVYTAHLVRHFEKSIHHLVWLESALIIICLLNLVSIN